MSGQFRIFTAVVCLILIAIVSMVGGADRGAAIKIKDNSGKEVNLYGESHALVIGVSAYQAGWPKLPGVINDVEVVTTLLTEQGFEVVTVINPSRDKLLMAFDDFIQKYGSKPDNRLLFYFAGHGHTVKKSYGDDMGYIVPVDAPRPDKDRSGFLAKAVDMQQIESYAKRIDAKHALFLFDSCFSGSIFDMSRAVPEIISYKASKPVRQFITSGAADEPVPDKSIFLEQFKAALEGAAADKDGYITGTALGEYLQNTVTNYSKGTQHPQYGKIRNPKLDKGDFVFKVKEEVAVATIPTSGDSPSKKTGKFSLDDLKRQREVEAQNAKKLEEMKSAFSELKSYLQTESNVDNKITALTRFNDVFSEEGSSSVEAKVIMDEVKDLFEKLKYSTRATNTPTDESRSKPEPTPTPNKDNSQKTTNAIDELGTFKNLSGDNKAKANYLPTDESTSKPEPTPTPDKNNSQKTTNVVNELGTFKNLSGN
ncbi:caspase family protein [Candidatus Magnetomonas plexicatena]|uniref:caspase family protein n=1 Tax=Candidatus Magnetomonas plexicatena TaxID=2552947 RepID=UPI001C7977A3|nr:caspase family protein [Nitrospirales bacterium LBB_01]QWR76932.1 caspase family protein [Nitrospirales bacterium LBB_01]